MVSGCLQSWWHLLSAFNRKFTAAGQQQQQQQVKAQQPSSGIRTPGQVSEVCSTDQHMALAHHTLATLAPCTA